MYRTPSKWMPARETLSQHRSGSSASIVSTSRGGTNGPVDIEMTATRNHGGVQTYQMEHRSGEDALRRAAASERTASAARRARRPLC